MPKTLSSKSALCDHSSINKREEKQKRKQRVFKEYPIKMRGKGKKTLAKEEALKAEMDAIVLRKKLPDESIACKCSKS
jgi:hypothetical protein